MNTLVELCAGSAAVSLRWLSSSGRPPLGYQGGKRGYADKILTAMGLCPGGGALAGEVVLVEPGPWGEAWQQWKTPAGRTDTIERLRALARHWQDNGAVLVAVSEAEPLSLAGWYHMELGGPSGFGRTFSNQRREFLTMSQKPKGQMCLL